MKIDFSNVSLRVAVSSICNLDCIYCPRKTGMEDVNPPDSSTVPHDEWLELLYKLVKVLGIQDVSLTGGEALLNPHLEEIAKVLRPIVPKLELNTNGLLLNETRSELVRMFDRVKISIDSLESSHFDQLTGNRGKRGLQEVFQAVDIVKKNDVNVAINAVVSSDTIDEIPVLISWAKDKDVTLQLLDFYYSIERHDYWERTFVPSDNIFDLVTSIYGSLHEELPLNGCKYYQAGGTSEKPAIRIKSSFASTTRSELCKNCPEFCQEGVYSLRYSTRGFVTYCPTYIKGHGNFLQSTMSDDEILSIIQPIAVGILEAKVQPATLQEMVDKRNLHPLVFGMNSSISSSPVVFIKRGDGNADA